MEAKKSEWTSYSDIGKYYNDQMLEITEYLAIEEKYLDALLLILQEKKIWRLKVMKLEKRRTLDQIDKFMQSKNLFISNEGRKCFWDYYYYYYYNDVESAFFDFLEAEKEIVVSDY